MEKKLNRIYKPAIASFNVSTTEEHITADYTTDGEAGFYGKPAPEIRYTIDMLEVVNQYQKKHYANPNKLYVFLVDSATKAEQYGYSAFGQPFIYIFADRHEGGIKDIAHTIAHEIGHAGFLLEHPIMLSSEAKNLMETSATAYSKAEKDELWLIQWDVVHGGNLTGFWGEGREYSGNQEELLRKIKLPWPFPKGYAIFYIEKDQTLKDFVVEHYSNNFEQIEKDIAQVCNLKRTKFKTNDRILIPVKGFINSKSWTNSISQKDFEKKIKNNATLIYEKIGFGNLKVTDKWRIFNEGNDKILQSISEPAQAINDLFTKDKSKVRLDCYFGTKVLIYKTILDLIYSQKFNYLFGFYENEPIRLSITRSDLYLSKGIFNRLNDFLYTPENQTIAEVGDWVYYANDERYNSLLTEYIKLVGLSVEDDKKYSKEEIERRKQARASIKRQFPFQGENMICTGTNTYFAFGVGEVSKEKIDHELRKSFESLLGYVNNKRQKVGFPRYKYTYNPLGFLQDNHKSINLIMINETLK